jgi:hypothetical protein
MRYVVANWMCPADPDLQATLVRMASIPHGTTINAQCIAPDPTKPNPGPPPFDNLSIIPAVDVTPFFTTTGKPQLFASQQASATNTPRLPQDLTNFIAAGTITQEILDNPNLVLLNAIQGQNITETFVFKVSTIPPGPVLGGGVANIAFLQGSSAGVGIQSGPNAVASSMNATFWIETVQAEIDVPIFTPGQAPLYIQIPAASPGGQAGPTFLVNPPQAITAPKTISVTFTQIQYMQTVILNFAPLSWPHVSCATLIPSGTLEIPPEAYN